MIRTSHQLKAGRIRIFNTRSWALFCDAFKKITQNASACVCVRRNRLLVCFFIFSVSLWTGRNFSFHFPSRIRFFYFIYNINVFNSFYFGCCLACIALCNLFENKFSFSVYFFLSVVLGWYVSDVNVCLHPNLNLSFSPFIHFLWSEHIDLVKWCVHVFFLLLLLWCTCVNKCVLS